jgi:tight adherence protein C
MSPLVLFLALACVAGGGVLAVLALGGQRSRVATGVNQIAKFYGQQAPGRPAAVPQRQIRPLQERFRALVARLLPGTSQARLRHRLDIAGNPAGWSIERILAYKAAAAVFVAAFGYVLGTGHVGRTLAFALLGGIAGFFVPNLLVYNLALKRQTLMQQALPDAMDMMTVCVEAGLGFDAAVARVARNITGPLSAEFARMLQEMQFGLSRVEALKAMAARTTVVELRTLVSSLVQASKLGIPIATVMREQASEMRVRRRQRAEEAAQKVTVKILFPLIFCLLPALFVVVMGPGVLNIVKSLSGVH